MIGSSSVAAPHGRPGKQWEFGIGGLSINEEIIKINRTTCREMDKGIEVVVWKKKWGFNLSCTCQSYTLTEYLTYSRNSLANCQSETNHLLREMRDPLNPLLAGRGSRDPINRHQPDGTINQQIFAFHKQRQRCNPLQRGKRFLRVEWHRQTDRGYL